MKASTANLLRFAAAAISVSTCAVVDAWSGGVGTCNVTPDGPAFPDSGNPHVNNGQGELSEASFEVTVNGVAITPGTPVDAMAGTDQTIVVSASGGGGSGGFRGYLITLSSPTPGQDLSGSLGAVNATATRILQADGEEGAFATATTPAVCRQGVAGASHTEAGVKSAVSVVASLPPSGVDGPLNMTVTLMVAMDMWYHSNFVMNVDGGAANSTAGDVVIDGGAVNSTAGAVNSTAGAANSTAGDANSTAGAADSDDGDGDGYSGGAANSSDDGDGSGAASLSLRGTASAFAAASMGVMAWIFA